MKTKATERMAIKSFITTRNFTPHRKKFSVRSAARRLKRRTEASDDVEHIQITF